MISFRQLQKLEFYCGIGLGSLLYVIILYILGIINVYVKEGIDEITLSIFIVIAILLILFFLKAFIESKRILKILWEHYM